MTREGRLPRRWPSLALVLAAALASLAPCSAWANRTLLSQHALVESRLAGPCGIAVSSGKLYVADYYGRSIDAFTLPEEASGENGVYLPADSIALPGAGTVPMVNTFDADCELAVGVAGALYANEWHEAAVRLKPSGATIDTGESTGVAVDGAGHLYVDDCTHVAEYAAGVEPGEAPLAQIGLGHLGDAYGLAVAPDGSRIYVADAASSTVEVFEPKTSLTAPVATITGAATPRGRFVSLTDAALAIDPNNGHVVVVDDLQPGYEHPEAAVYEFDSSGSFLGKLPGSPVFGEPSGIAVAPPGSPGPGRLYLTNGNGGPANVFTYGPYKTSFSEESSSSGSASSPATGGGVGQATSVPADEAEGSNLAAASEVLQRGRVRVRFRAELSPHRLPRTRLAPVRFSLGAEIATTDGSVPPQLRRIAVEINRHGHFDPGGLPRCAMGAIQPSTDAAALAACRRSLIGEGRFSAKVLLPEQSPFPSDGKVLAFSGTYKGRPAILAHVYGTDPVPTSYTIPFAIGKARGGTYGTTLRTQLPDFGSKWGYVTEISFDVGRGGYLRAACPAPAGFSRAPFALARVKLSFTGAKAMSTTISRVCRVRGG